ncbi:aminopeptidase [Lutibacter sp. A80]|uniref:aminopeptidase n=1 Tax=Lutibacter sp. A80 TaxID=2918453 RepID=UPI001F060DE8|nr:aminopeptidase [Lutibacter sp. A80]UMB60511.1 aminopeptidase [Lutibacter sp. A80]
MSKIYAQTDKITMQATLFTNTNEIKIQQETTFYNKSDSILNEVYFHNWPNAYKDKQTPLAKRFIENYSKTFHFANDKYRGNTKISGVSVNFNSASFEITKDNPDLLKINLHQELKPNDSVKISTTYLVKIPNDKFTKYGENELEYNLRYWYLTPAIFDTKWQLYNNLDMDDLYIDYTDYNINLKVPKEFYVNTDLKSTYIIKDSIKNYNLTGKNRFDIALNITKENNFKEYTFDDNTISTNLQSDDISENLKTSILKREFYFIQTFLGKYPHDKILLNKVEYDKNPVYGFNQLPSFLAAYNNAFEWDIKLFKILSRKYIDQVFLVNNREDYWLTDGLHAYLIIKYVERFYPEIKAIGNISKLWGIRNFSISKLDFNEKYHFIYQFAARKNLDQALTTQADSLSNFNRKIANKYKAGLGLKYLESYVEDYNIPSSIFEFSYSNSGKKIKSNDFLNYLKSKTTKDLTWFENDYLKTNKKIDYTIKNIINKNDSLEISIENKRNFTAPIQLFGIKDKEIKFKKWLTNIDSITTITIPKDGFDKLSLNYDSQLPEYNLRNNWKDIDNKIFNRPLQLKFFKDIEDTYYNQLFYTPIYKFNYYDGLVLGVAFSNKTLLNKNINYKITPSFSTKSKTLSGSASFQYEYLPENKKINKLSFGISGSNFLYAPNLSYTTIKPYAFMEFRRKSLRDVRSKALIASLTFVDKEKSPTQTEHYETNKYSVFNLGYGYSKPGIIDDVRLSTNLEVSSKFSKLSLTAQYRKLTDANRQFDFRFFAGAFITNKTESNYFSFALDRPTDYLFQYDYLGRSETSGIFSQQVIINEGGFKSKLPVSFANQWLSTLNTSVGIWRWIEVYNDVGFVKNRNESVYFAHENGIRLNFIQDILEVYFPFYSNLGWEVSAPQYSSKIRFVLVIKPKQIYNFVKRGFY